MPWNFEMKKKEIGHWVVLSWENDMFNDIEPPIKLHVWLPAIIVFVRCFQQTCPPVLENKGLSKIYAWIREDEEKDYRILDQLFNETRYSCEELSVPLFLMLTIFNFADTRRQSIFSEIPET